jgi:hypothetical protein
MGGCGQRYIYMHYTRCPVVDFYSGIGIGWLDKGWWLDGWIDRGIVDMILAALTGGTQDKESIS